MEMLYIINPQTFNGGILNTMPFVDKGAKNGMDILNSTYVHYSDKSFYQYNADNGGQLVALTWEEFSEQYYNPYLTSLQGEWVKITQEAWWDALECLPPKRWTQGDNGEFFFMREAYVANIHSCYVRYQDKYFTARRAINTPANELLTLSPPTC